MEEARKAVEDAKSLRFQNVSQLAILALPEMTEGSFRKNSRPNFMMSLNPSKLMPSGLPHNKLRPSLRLWRN